MKKKSISALILSSAIATNIIVSEDTLAKAVEDNNENNDKNISNKVEAKAQAPVLNGITVNKQLIDINYSKGITIVPRYIVIHDTDNRKFGANAMANRNYFANHIEAKASAHFTVDQNNIIQCLEETWRGWHVGDGDNPFINNSNTIGIELCVNVDNDFNKTLENGIALTKYLMEKYSIPADRVVRHYDVSQKICPKMMIQDKPELWTYFKKTIGSFDTNNINNSNTGNSGGTQDKLDAKAKGRVINVSTFLNVRADSNGMSQVVSKVAANAEVSLYEEKNGWYKIHYMENQQKKYGYVSKTYIRIIDGALNGETNSTTDTGTSTNNNNNNSTTNNNNNNASTNNSGTTINKNGKVVNVSTTLNVRNGSSTSSLVIGYLKKDEVVKINYEENGWYNVTFGGNRTGFVKKDYINIIQGNSSSASTNNSSSTNTNTNTNTNNSTTSNNGSNQSTKKGKVYNVSTSLNVRKGPGSNYAVVTYLLNDVDVEVIEESGEWYKVRYNGREGYASKKYIKIVEQSSAAQSNNSSANSTQYKEGTVINVSNNLNVRKGPGTNTLVVGYLLPNGKVKVKGLQNGWYNIIFETNAAKKEGFVKAEYLKVQ